MSPRPIHLQQARLRRKFPNQNAQQDGGENLTPERFCQRLLIQSSRCRLLLVTLSLPPLMLDGTTRPLHLHAYPKSSGIVLRVIGREIDEICGGVAEAALEEVLAARLAQFGPHPSHLPGWKPPWMKRREARKGK